MLSTASTIVNLSSGFILLPLLTKYLQDYELSLWFVFLTLGSLGQLLDFGFRPTITRNVSLVISGRQSLLRQGMAVENAHDSPVNINLLAQLIESSQSIYKRIGILNCALLLLPGLIYIFWLASNAPNWQFLIAAWVVFSLSSAIGLYSGFMSAIIDGSGFQQISLGIQVFVRLLAISLSAISLLLNLGLLGLSSVQLIGAILLWFCLAKKSRSLYPISASFKNPNILTRENKITDILWFNAKRQGLVQIGAFMIQRASLLVAASTLGLASSASYSLTLTVLFVISGVSQSIFSVNVPLLVQLRNDNRFKLLELKYNRLLAFAMLSCSLSYALVIFFGNIILVAIGSKTLLLGRLELVAFCVVLVLELFHSLAATFITTGNTVPFVTSSIVSGAAILLGSIVAAPVFGVMGLIAAQGLVQALYNNWYWPLMARNELVRGKLAESASCS